MKKEIVLIAILAAGLTMHGKGLDLGLQGGMNVTSMFGKNPIPKKSAAVRYAAEIFVRYNFTDMISIRTGVGFEEKGYRMKDLDFTDQAGNIIGSGTLQQRLRYITIPVLAEFTFGKKCSPL